MITTPQLIIRSKNLPGGGTVAAPADGLCVTCGAPYCAGDRVLPWDPPDSFTEYSDLANPVGEYACDACAGIFARGKDFTQSHTKVIVSQDDLYPCFSNDDVAYWLLNPPEPPFSIFISTQQQGHIAWKAPVSFSRDMILVRYDDKLLRIRRAFLLEGIEAAKLLLPELDKRARERAQEKGKPLRGKLTPLTLLMDIDRNLTRSTHGHFKPDVPELAKESIEYGAAYAAIKALNAGELWGLVQVLYSENPVKPAPRKL